MSKTLGRWEGQTPFTDGQIFVSAKDFTPIVSASAVLTSASAGLLTQNVPASTTANFFAVLSQLMTRTGQLATAAVNQEQFGTAALLPGPQLTTNTTDPLNLPGGFPPWTNAVNPVITGGLRGPAPKGYAITRIDVVYEVNTVALTSATLNLTNTVYTFPTGIAAPVVSNILALANYGMPLTTNTAGQARRFPISPATPVFITTDASELILNLNFVTPASSTMKLYGAVVLFNYNLA